MLLFFCSCDDNVIGVSNRFINGIKMLKTKLVGTNVGQMKAFIAFLSVLWFFQKLSLAMKQPSVLV